MTGRAIEKGRRSKRTAWWCCCRLLTRTYSYFCWLSHRSTSNVDPLMGFVPRWSNAVSSLLLWSTLPHNWLDGIKHGILIFRLCFFGMSLFSESFIRIGHNLKLRSYNHFLRYRTFDESVSCVQTNYEPASWFLRLEVWVLYLFGPALIGTIIVTQFDTCLPTGTEWCHAIPISPIHIDTREREYVLTDSVTWRKGRFEGCVGPFVSSSLTSEIGILRASSKFCWVKSAKSPSMTSLSTGSNAGCCTMKPITAWLTKFWAAMHRRCTSDCHIHILMCGIQKDRQKQCTLDVTNQLHNLQRD
jgi:hypothetical protein